MLAILGMAPGDCSSSTRIISTSRSETTCRHFRSIIVANLLADTLDNSISIGNTQAFSRSVPGAALKKQSGINPERHCSDTLDDESR